MIYINTYICCIHILSLIQQSSTYIIDVSCLPEFKTSAAEAKFPILDWAPHIKLLATKNTYPSRNKSHTKGPMFDAPNMAESLNMSSFVPVQGGISSACDIFEYLHLCAFMCLPSAPRHSASQQPRGCVCNAHPCWNDQGVVHKCPGDRKEDSWAVSDLGGDGENLEIFFENHRVV